ncbi:hypothetical protein C8R48DRAFT_837907 [Suillus tomentosus]|nr:hypothetical protein C8R48DRAFT_837907 [Suillus tomentosus]
MSSPPVTTTPAATTTGSTSTPVTTPPTTTSSSASTPTTTSSSTTPTSSSTSSSSTASTTSASSTTQSTSATSSSTSSTQTSISVSATTPTTIATTSPTPTLSASVYTSTSGGVVITSVTYVTVATSTPSSANDTATSSNSFFSNTGAVAGVFTVVGLIVIAIFIAIVTNAVRRRRAKKFDRDVAEAAAEAAASSRSPFDDYAYSNNGGSGGGYPYSDTTHGTFGQAPMNLPSDTYGMSEMTQYDPYAAGAVSLATANVGRTRSRQDSETHRAPGIAGVGAGNLAREPSRRTPYHAFAGPGPQPHEILDHTSSGRYRSRGIELLEGAGLAGTGVAAMAAANNGAYINRRPSEYTRQTHGSMRSHGHSQGHSSSENYSLPLQPVYQSPPRNDTQFADAYAGFVNSPSQLPLNPGVPIPHEASPSPPPTQSHSPVGEVEGEDYHDDGPPSQRMSYADDEDYGQHNRVLRVANE